MTASCLTGSSKRDFSPTIPRRMSHLGDVSPRVPERFAQDNIPKVPIRNEVYPYQRKFPMWPPKLAEASDAPRTRGVNKSLRETSSVNVLSIPAQRQSCEDQDRQVFERLPLSVTQTESIVEFVMEVGDDIVPVVKNEKAVQDPMPVTLMPRGA